MSRKSWRMRWLVCGWHWSGCHKVSAGVAAFLFFRFADIVKPGPIGALDRKLHSGLGIMADDMLAGGLTALVLALAAFALA